MFLNPPSQKTTYIFSFFNLPFRFEKMWKIEDVVSNATAVTTASLEEYALGKQEWSITGDHVNCHKGGNYSTLLKLTGCKAGEFTCDDGECVSMEQRCDQLSDCRSVLHTLHMIFLLPESFPPRIFILWLRDPSLPQ